MGRALTIVLPAAVLAGSAWADGGYFARTWGWLLVVAGAVVAAAATAVERLELGRRALVFVGGLLALGAWQLASSVRAVAPDAAVLEAERTLLYAAVAGGALLAVPRGRSSELRLAVLLGTGAATCAGLVVHVLSPGAPPGRLEAPVGYANAAGILAVTALLLGLGSAGAERGTQRALAACVSVPAAAVLALTLSRGALLAGALGLAMLVVTGRSVNYAVRLGVVALPSAAAAVAVLAGDPFSRPDAAGTELAWLAVLGALGIASSLLASWTSVLALPSIRGGRAAVTAGVVAAAALLTVAGALEVTGEAPPPAVQQGGPGRLLSASTGDRADYWRVAAVAVADEPSLGIGAGGFARRWERERDELVFVRDAHNLYLETLAELGPVGLGALLAVVAAPLVARRRCVHSDGPALAAYLALAAHAGVDWDWELPAVTLCLLLLGVVLLHADGRASTRRLGRATRVGLSIAAAALVSLGVIVSLGAASLDKADRALDRGDAATARENARRARRLAPWSAEPWQLLGEAELAAGRVPRAQAHLRRATREDPRSWTAWLALAVATDGVERAAAIGRARELNPLAPEIEFVAGDP